MADKTLGGILIYSCHFTGKMLFIRVGSVKETMRNEGDSLELLSLSLVLDVRHSAKAQESELQTI